MIDKTALFLTHTDCNIPALKKHGLGIGPNADFDGFFVEPLRTVFSEVLVYDIWRRYAEVGPSQSNREILDLVRARHPRYVVWPSMMYEIAEATFTAIRQSGAIVVGWFFDDEMRFENYSHRWIPYLDYCFTNDPEAFGRYAQLGGKALLVVLGSNPEIFRRLPGPLEYDVTFVGRKFGGRGVWIEQLCAEGIRALAFGKGWPHGYVSTADMVRIFNSSKINLCFTQSYAMGARPQMKDRIFHICMAGGFLLCEYIPGIEQFFDLDREIVCFRDLAEATAKIRCFLDNETERQAIAQAGWERANREHSQAARMSRAFAMLEADLAVHGQNVSSASYSISPVESQRLPFSFHFEWAKGLMAAGYPRDRWLEELNAAARYEAHNPRLCILRALGYLPATIRPLLFWLLSIRREFRRWRARGGKRLPS
jgi:hypothetical protein